MYLNRNRPSRVILADSCQRVGRLRGRSNRIDLAPAGDEIMAGPTPVGEMEVKTRIEQAARNDAAAFQDKLGFRTNESRSDGEDPLGRGKTYVAGAPGAAQTAHELAVADGVWGRNIHSAFQILMIHHEFNGANEIDVVNPRHILLSGPGFTADTPAHEAQKNIKSPVRLRAHHHRAAQGQFAGVRRVDSKESTLPAGGDVDAEAPGFGNAGLGFADFASSLVHLPINTVSVDGCCAGIQPEPWRMRRGGDRFADEARCKDAGVFDFAPISVVVAAVDGVAREIYDDISAIQSTSPWAGPLGVPDERLPLGRLGMPSDDRNRVPLLMEVPGQDLAQVTTATRQDNT